MVNENPIAWFIPGAALAYAAVTDTRTRTIPLWLFPSACCLQAILRLTGTISGFSIWHAAGLILPGFLILIFALAGFCGGGDVLLFAGLGFMIGCDNLCYVMLCMLPFAAVIGAVAAANRFAFHREPFCVPAALVTAAGYALWMVCLRFA